LFLAKDSADRETGRFPQQPTSAMGRALLALINQMWCYGIVPDCLALAAIISIHKKDAPEDPSNYRGISLLEPLIKIVSGALASRLSAKLQTRLSPFQSGFRASEEAISQHICLREICLRRYNENLPTVVSFVDIRKAFDTVPHKALLYKCKLAGIHGRALQFISALYRNPMSQVSSPSGPAGAPFPVERGVRQGCPLSPLLFNIFIDDLVPTVNETSDVAVPGLPSHRSVGILLFADDAAIVRDSPEAMQDAMFSLDRWLRCNGLEANVDKCGVMLIGSAPQDTLLANIRLQCHRIPVVECYKYLGISFHRSLDITACLQPRLSSLASKMGVIRSFTLKATNPFLAKICLLKSVAIPSLAFGGEVFGMSGRNKIARLDTMLNSILRAFTKSWGTAPAFAPLRMDLGIMPIFARMAGQRIRAFTKFRNSATFISTLLGFPSNSRRRSWASGTKSWCRSFCPKALQSSSPREARDEVSTLLSRRAAASNYSRALYSYFENGYFYSSAFLNDAVKRRSLSIGYGISGLLALRCGGFTSATRAARLGLIPASFLTTCPCCNSSVPESVSHMLLSCSAWSSQRKQFLRPLISKLPSNLSGTEMVALLCGGMAGGEATKTFQSKWIKSDNDRPPYYFNVATFLNVIFKDRASLVWRHSTLSRGPLGGGP
jgi:hypothetical protein